MFSALGNILVKLLGGTRNERVVRGLMHVVREKVNVIEEGLREEYFELVRQLAAAEKLDEAELIQSAGALQVMPLAARAWLTGKSTALRARLAEGESARAVLPEAFAVIRFASWLALDHRQFDVQLVAGQVLYNSTIAEEATGEGKTFACYPAIYLAALAGKKVHLVTVNDYLVQRDAERAALPFALVGMTVGFIQQPMDSPERKKQYACDVVYGTNSEFGFDYLRDNMKLSAADQVQGSLDCAVIDEVDSILIDEARTPLIISGPAYGDVDRYRKADAVAREIISRHRPYDQAAKRVESAKRALKALEGETARAAGEEKAGLNARLEKAREELAAAEAHQAAQTKYYEVELDKKTVRITHEGVGEAQEIAGIGSFYVGANMEWPHLMDQALRAHVVYERDKEYVVRQGEVVIVDEFTGRLMEGRQWSDGLHQAVEAKERVTVKEENQTMATITIQNYFKLYGKLAGMTGTAMTESEEFQKIYKLDVVTVPTHRPVNRVDYQDRIYGTVEEKYDALVEEIRHYALDLRRPVLVGTTSIEKSDKLSGLLTHRYGIAHEVLNARPENAAREADIVALAGQQHPVKSGSKELVGNVTIATNMAGRGTDIKLAPAVVWHNCRTPTRAELEKLGVESEDLFPPGATKCCIYCPQYDARTNCAHCFKPKIDAAFPKRGRTDCREEVPCGLHIVGTERHEARRIDNQLRGRSGRQGNPGSSRFFLSLRDDLMSVFAGEWTIKVLGWLGLQGGQPIEDKRISKGIARAQKKVEQRNFDIRKNLLEYDEVMDHQRKFFYARRQQALRGENISESVREMIDETITDGVADYLAGKYVARTIAKWAHQNLELNIAADRIRGEGPEDLPGIESDLRDRAKEEAASTISLTIGEYADPEAGPEEWDLKGLASWAMSRFQVNVSQNQLRKLAVPEIEQLLTEGARAHLDTVDFSPLLRFLEPGFTSRSLAEWARNKFGVELPPDELPADQPDVAERNLRTAVEQFYLRREIEYPVEYAIDYTVAQAGTENPYAARDLVEWANRKYRLDWTVERVAGMSVEDVRAELVRLSQEYLTGGKLEREIDEALAAARVAGVPPARAAGVSPAEEDGKTADGTSAGRAGETPATRDELFQFMKTRFDTTLVPEDLEGKDLRAELIAAGRAFLRRELTELERVVLLQIYDDSWVGHLLAMDHLKSGVGLRSYAEQDPKIAYKREGARLFQEMLGAVQDKVTDLVFKARLGRQAQVRSAYQVSSLVHEQLATYDQAAQEMSAQQQAATQPQKVQQIVRTQPKVGRNDPCPCGSGKKYKKCHGKE